MIRRAFPWLLFSGILLFALNLRGPIVAVAPVLPQIQADLGLTAGVAGLLTTIPVLCFALATPFASWVIGRFGAELAILFSLIGILGATIIRSAGGGPGVIIGTIILGIAITIGNVVVPVVVRRDFAPNRVAIATGAYTAALNVGSMLTSIGTVPLANAFGWQVALMLWGVLVLVALIVLLFAFRTSRASRAAAALIPEAVSSVPIRPPWRSLTAWALLLAFGGQAFSYYGITAWMPTLLHDEIGLAPTAAGIGSSIFQILAVVGALGVPVLAHYWKPWQIIALISALWVTLPLGLIFAPQYWWLWSILAGAAQGGGITIVFIVIVRLARSNDHARSLSAFVQGGGYLLAAAGPLVVGAAHESSGGWVLPMIVVLFSACVLAAAGIFAALRADRPLPSLE